MICYVKNYSVETILLFEASTLRNAIMSLAATIKSKLFHAVPKCLLLPLFYMPHKPEYIFKHFENLHIAVIGDVMLDNYFWGKVDRLSPEAPVPVVDIYKKDARLGGAANVALNCVSLGAKTTLLSVIGNDDDGKLLLQLLQENKLNADYITASKNRITTTKTRILSNKRQMLRLDTETTEELNTEDEHSFIDKSLRFLQIQKPDIVILQDYNKGVLKENVIQKIIAHCKSLKIPVAVDPKKKNFFAYKGVDIFKPNYKEISESLPLSIDADQKESLEKAHNFLAEKLQHSITFLTLSDKGVYYHDGKESAIIPSHLRNISDVSGAGDTVIAVAAMVYVLTKDVRLMAEYANIAGGLVCEEIGVMPVNKERMLAEVKKLSINI